MANEKKFLDSSGIGHLWDRIEERYPNMDELGLIIDAIDEAKADRTDIIQADWNQNDETALDYVKNRTHWAEHKTLFTLSLDETITVHNQYSDIEAQGYSYKQVNMAAWEFTKNIGAINLEELIGGELRFRRKKYDAELGRYTEIESHTLQITSDFISNDTLLVQPDRFNRILQLTSSGDLTLFCEGGADSKLPWDYPTSLEILNVKQIDPMFISIPNDNILNGSAEGSLRTIYSASENDEYTMGESAFAEGDYTKASGYASHAEGQGTIASEHASHAEGDSTEASGYASHAEGYATIAPGNGSHAEGVSTTASGEGSHAEGAGTIASGEYQHVQGRFNIEDTENKYAHIVGNGDYSDGGNLYSNAHTLDWDGNAWFAGTIKMGGTGQDDENAVEVVTKIDLNSYEFITVADIDAICNAVTEGSLESTDVDYLMAQLNYGVSEDELSPDEIEKLMNKLQ